MHCISATAVLVFEQATIEVYGDSTSCSNPPIVLKSQATHRSLPPLTTIHFQSMALLPHQTEGETKFNPRSESQDSEGTSAQENSAVKNGVETYEPGTYCRTLLISFTVMDEPYEINDRATSTEFKLKEYSESELQVHHHAGDSRSESQHGKDFTSESSFLTLNI